MKLAEYRTARTYVADSEYTRWAALPVERLGNVVLESKAMVAKYQAEYDYSVANRPAYAPGPTKTERQRALKLSQQQAITEMLRVMYACRKDGRELPR